MVSVDEQNQQRGGRDAERAAAVWVERMDKCRLLRKGLRVRVNAGSGARKLSGVRGPHKRWA